MFEVTLRSIRTLSVVVLYAHFFVAGSNTAACLPSIRLVSPPFPSAALCTGVVSLTPIGTWLLPVGVGTLGHTLEPKPRCISMPVHRSSPCRPCESGGAVVQVVTVVEGCHDAGIGSDLHRRGRGVQLRFSPSSRFQCRSWSQNL